jgi:very-short-patch-repair endonuclease
MRDGQKLDIAKQLRVDSTPAEKRLWEQLRNRQLAKQKFRRQAPIGPYIVDFICLERKLIIEIDGWTHSTEAEVSNDKRRTAYLESQGYKVIRFHNAEIKEGMDEVLTLIAEALK